MKECRLIEEKKRHLKAGTYRKVPGEKLKQNTKIPSNSSAIWHSLQLWQTGNTDESSKRFPRECKWTCSSSSLDPQDHSVPTPRILFSIQLLTSIHPPSILPSMVLPCQVFLICLPSNKRLSGGRFGKKDEDTLKNALLLLFSKVLIPALFLLFFYESLWTRRKMEVCTFFFVFPLSSGNRIRTCLPNLADTQASSTHTSTLMTSTARPFSMIQPSEKHLKH